MEDQNIDIVTVAAETVETEAASPLKEKVANHLDQAKAEGKDRAKRIKDIFAAAFTEAVSEVKGGSGEVWKISKDSIADVLEMEMPIPDSEAKTPEDEPFWKSVFNSIQLKIQAYLKQEYDHLPERFSTVKKNAAEWDAELNEKYGDRYTQTKHTARETFTKATDWYRKAMEKAEALNTQATPVEQKQSDIETEAAVAGAKVAEKEREIKQQVKDTVQSVITADA